jgi:hypothetical protein
VREDNLNYIGFPPNIDFFNKNISEKDYMNFFKENKLFNLRNKTIEYCINDVKLTLELLNKVLNVMDLRYISLFKKSYSLPSLSYKIFFKY